MVCLSSVHVLFLHCQLAVSTLAKPLVVLPILLCAASVDDAFWAAPGCAHHSNVPPKLLFLEHGDLASVRCCSSDGKSCHTKEEGCEPRATYLNAKSTCQLHGLRLCTWDELKNNICCGTGCGFDGHLIWTSSSRSQLLPIHHGDAIWAAPVCHRRARIKPVVLWPNKGALAPVRCCSVDGMSCHRDARDCIVRAHYEGAERYCASRGQTLCTRNQLEANVCCDHQCDHLYDLLVWTADDASRSVPHAAIVPTNFKIIAPQDKYIGPELYSLAPVWAVPICGGRSQEYNRFYWPQNGDLAHVRCCSTDGHTCLPIAMESCFTQVQYQGAADICESQGLRLCTRAELSSAACCRSRSGCGEDLFGSMLVWSSDTQATIDVQTQATMGLSHGAPGDSVYNRSFWAAPSCSLRTTLRPKALSLANSDVPALVRCCSLDGTSCNAKGVGCASWSQYTAARQICSAHGMRLCTRNELLTNICCNSFCSVDGQLAWTSDEASSASQPSALALPLEPTFDHTIEIWAVPGCTPRHSHLRPKRLEMSNGTASVRCCAKDGRTCLSKLQVEGCVDEALYTEAAQLCFAYGLRLCTRVELEENLCCRTGCGFDGDLVWSQAHPIMPNETRSTLVAGSKRWSGSKLQQNLDGKATNASDAKERDIFARLLRVLQIDSNSEPHITVVDELSKKRFSFRDIFRLSMVVLVAYLVTSATCMHLVSGTGGSTGPLIRKGTARAQESRMVLDTELLNLSECYNTFKKQDP